MSIVRSLPCVDVGWANPAQACIRNGMSRHDAAGSIWNGLSIGRDDGGFFVSYDNAYFDSCNDKDMTRDFEYDPITGGMHLRSYIHGYDNTFSGIDLPSNADADDTVIWDGDGTWKSVIGDGAQFAHIISSDTNDDALSSNRYRYISTDYTIQEGEWFALSIKRFVPQRGVDPDNTVVYVYFGGVSEWCIGLYQTKAPSLFQFNGDTGIYDQVSVGPSDMFNVGITDTLVVRTLWDTIEISNGLDHSRESTWFHKCTDYNWNTNNMYPAIEDGLDYPAINSSVPYKLIIELYNTDAMIALLPIRFVTGGQILSPYIPHDFSQSDFDMNADWGVYSSNCDGTFSASGTNAMVGDKTCVYYQVDMGMSTSGIYSPVFWGVNLHKGPEFIDIEWPELPSLSGADVTSLNIRADTEGYNGTITFSNQNPDGKFTGLSGAKRIYVDAGWHFVDEDTGEYAGYDTVRIYTGWIWEPEYTHNDSTADVSWQLLDAAAILRDTPAIAIPPLDGTCELWAILQLGYHAGCQDDPSDLAPGLLAWQDQVTGQYATIRDHYGVVDSLCSIGKCNHKILPSMSWTDNPMYKFEDSVPIYDCMQQIRTWSMSWMFINNWGNLIYQSPEDDTNPLYRDNTNSNAYDCTLTEDAVTDYTELLKSITVKYPTSFVKNAIMVQGLDFQHITPIMSIVKANLSDASVSNYMPWYRWHIMKNVQFISPEITSNIAHNIFSRATRPRPMTGLSIIGGVYFPYYIARIDTPITNGAYDGIGSVISDPRFRIISISYDLSNAESKEYTHSIDGEWVDPIYSYDPIY